jgi:hypothetical protein
MRGKRWKPTESLSAWRLHGPGVVIMAKGQG